MMQSHAQKSVAPNISTMEGNNYYTCPVTNIGFDQSETPKNVRRLLIAIGLCTFFMIAEIVGGLLSGSLAVITDAAHLMSDIAGFLVSLFAIQWARKPANQKMSYGYHRAEILGALLSIAMVWCMTGYLVIEAIDRVRHPQAVNGKIMCIVAGLGLVVNIVMGLSLHHGHHDHHGPNGRHPKRPKLGHQDASCSKNVGSTCSRADLVEEAYDAENATTAANLDQQHVDGQRSQNGNGSKRSWSLFGSHEGNINIRAAFIHVLGDLVQSVGVLIAAIIILYKPTWTLADPICTFVFSVIVFATTLVLARDTIVILMEGTPSHIDPTQVGNDLLSIPGVICLHDLHIWCLSGGKLALTVHVVISSYSNGSSGSSNTYMSPPPASLFLTEDENGSRTAVPNQVQQEGATSIDEKGESVCGDGDRFGSSSRAVQKGPDPNILAQCHAIICDKYGIHHSTVQIETEADLASHCQPSTCHFEDGLAH